MGVIAKLFVQSKTESVASSSYKLGAVCRGEENKEWAAATPSGSLEIAGNDVLDAAHAPGGGREVYVTIKPDPAGVWQFDSCAFSYGGCVATFSQKHQAGYGKLALTINASAATKQLREAYAAALIAGTPALFTVTVLPVDA